MAEDKDLALRAALMPVQRLGGLPPLPKAEIEKISELIFSASNSLWTAFHLLNKHGYNKSAAEVEKAAVMTPVEIAENFREMALREEK